MKKLLIPTLILCLALPASAELIVTVNGEPQVDEIATEPCPSTIELGLELTDGHNCFMYTIDWSLSNRAAEFVYDYVELPTEYEWPAARTGQPQYYAMSASQWADPAPEGPAVLMQGLIVECWEPYDVTLTVVADPMGTIVDGQPVEGVLHTVRICCCVPEPTTVLLLGLGVVLLRRRRTYC